MRLFNFEGQELGLKDWCLVHPTPLYIYSHLPWSLMLKFMQFKIWALRLSIFNLFSGLSWQVSGHAGILR